MHLARNPWVRTPNNDFGVLVQHFKILQQPIWHWYLKDIVNILKCCVIVYNMTVKVCHNFNTFNNLRDIDNDIMAMEDNIPAVPFFHSKRKTSLSKWQLRVILQRYLPIGFLACQMLLQIMISIVSYNNAWWTIFKKNIKIDYTATLK